MQAVHRRYQNESRYFEKFPFLQTKAFCTSHVKFICFGALNSKLFLAKSRQLNVLRKVLHICQLEHTCLLLYYLYTAYFGHEDLHQVTPQK